MGDCEAGLLDAASMRGGVQTELAVKFGPEAEVRRDEKCGVYRNLDNTNIVPENGMEVVFPRDTLKLRVGINQQGEDGETVLRFTVGDVIKRPGSLLG